LAELGKQFCEARKEAMVRRQVGATAICNLIDDASSQDADIAHLRRLVTEIDNSVMASYGWRDLDLQHGFNEGNEGFRFSMSESARLEVLQRLLGLNHERHKAELMDAAIGSTTLSAKGGRKSNGAARREQSTMKFE
jgi:hypothetical protein